MLHALWLHALWLPEITIRQPPKSAAAYLSMSIDVVRDMIQHLIDRLDLDRHIEKAKVRVAA
jgi:hypothetical protein